MDAFVIVRGVVQSSVHQAHQLVRGVAEQRQIKLQLGREMLVENRFAHPGPIGDVIHRGGVVALLDEGALGRLEELGTTIGAAQPGSCPSRFGHR